MLKNALQSVRRMSSSMREIKSFLRKEDMNGMLFWVDAKTAGSEKN